jgi:hypothetical protein
MNLSLLYSGLILGLPKSALTPGLIKISTK